MRVDMNPESKTVKYLIKEIVYGNHKSQLLRILGSNNIDWEKLKSLLIYNELAPFLYLLSKENYSIIPKDLFQSLKNSYYWGLFRYELLFRELLVILKAAEKKGILIIPIKGLSFTEEYYGRFGFRPLVDIDLLIKEEDLEKGAFLLESLGYKKCLLGATEEYWLKKQCHLEFIKENKNMPIIAELHWALDFKRYNDEVMPDLWKRIQKTTAEGKDFFILSPEDTLLSLALHQRRFGKVFNLKYVCDAGIILEREKLDWDYILKTVFKERARASLYFLLCQVEFVLDINLNKYSERLKIPFWQKKLVSAIIKRYIYSPLNMNNIFYAYALCHLFLYDNISYPIRYILNIPQEQFAKFYSLPLYSKKTSQIYKMRFFYIVYRLFIPRTKGS